MKRHHSSHVYLLQCSDGSYYAGVTNDMERRLADHQQATDPKCDTASRRPVERVWSEWFRNIEDAIAFEKQLQGWSRRQKEALIRGDWRAIQALSRQTGAPAIPRAEAASLSSEAPFDSARVDS